MESAEKKRLNRRDFLRMSAVVTAGGVLAACAPKEVIRTVEVVKEVPVEVEVEVPVEVEVEVEVTKIVKEETEVEVEVTRVVEQPAAPESVVIKVLFRGIFLTHPAAGPQLSNYTIFLMDYNLKGTGTTVVYEGWPQGDDYDTKLRLMTNSGEIEDAVIWCNFQGVDFFVRDELLMPLDDLIDVNGVMVDEEWIAKANVLMRYDDATKKIGVGSHWGLPFFGRSGLSFLYTNVDMMNAAGAPLPEDDWTMLDVEEAATMVSKPDEGIFGYYHQTGGTEHSIGRDTAFVAPFGGAVLNDDGTKCLLNTAECQEAYQWNYDIRYVKRINGTPDDQSAFGGYREGSRAGKLAMYRNSVAGSIWYVQRDENVDPEMTWAKFPTSYDGRANGWRGHNMSVNWHGISANAKNPAECFDVLHYFSSLEHAKFGVESGTGWHGCRQDIIDDPFLDDYPLDKADLQLYGDAEPVQRPANGRSGEVNQFIAQRFSPVDYGDALPDQAFLDGLAAEIDEILAMDPE